MTFLHKIIFSVILITAGSCEPLQADFKDWDRKNKRLYKSFVTLQVLDTMQTLDMINCQKNNPTCYLQEKNRFLDIEPSSTELLLMKGLLNYGIYRTLNDNRVKPHHKTLVLTILVIGSLHTVSNNASNGISFSIKF
tara:strand:- start:1104 stop:1514 length:411 start_codon:yes stop_codon:yes gene_type:complete